jgi:serine/threonine protein kinase
MICQISLFALFKAKSSIRVKSDDGRITKLHPHKNMPESAHKVLHELTAAGLVSADQATDFDAELKTGAEALLTRLVADGHITEYQSQKFLQGQASDIYFGDYVVLEKLGQGGMGTVLLAKHRRMDRKVAIKILPVTALDSEAAVARFYQEVKVAAQLTHPNIVHAYDAGEHHGFHYLVMEYVPGHDLARVLSELGPIPPLLAVDYINQAAKGLEYAHRKGVVHRDIKPSNLLLDNEGTVKILDMGLARIGGAFDAEASAHLTTTGQMMGTVEYMSPEQAEDTRVADARSDIYSLGCTLYRLITGKGPFSRDTVVKTILAHRDAAPPRVALGFPEDDLIDQLFRKMVAKNPNQRFQTTTMLLESLRQIEEGEQVTTFETGQPPVTSHDTAVVYRVSTENSSAESIPEAIIPIGSSSSRQPVARIIEPPSGSMPATNPTSTSEILYIDDKPPIRRLYGFVRRTSRYVMENPHVRILLCGIISFATMGSLGLILGPINWIYANKTLRKIRDGKLQSKRVWAIRLGKILSIIATILSPFALIGFIAEIAGG